MVPWSLTTLVVKVTFLNPLGHLFFLHWGPLASRSFLRHLEERLCDSCSWNCAPESSWFCTDGNSEELVLSAANSIKRLHVIPPNLLSALLWSPSLECEFHWDRTVSIMFTAVSRVLSTSFAPKCFTHCVIQHI